MQSLDRLRRKFSSFNVLADEQDIGLLLQLLAQSPSSKTILQIAQYVSNSDAVDVGCIWKHIDPLVADKTLLAACLSVMDSIIQNHHKDLDLLRKTFFDTISSLELEYLDTGVTLLNNLTKCSKDTRYFEHEYGPLLARWLSIVIKSISLLIRCRRCLSHRCRPSSEI